MTIFRTAPELRPYSAEPWLCTLNSPSASTGKSVAGALATPPWLNEGCWRNESLLSTPSIKKILDFSRCPLTLNDPNDPRGVRGAAPLHLRGFLGDGDSLREGLRREQDIQVRVRRNFHLDLLPDESGKILGH